ncbi:MAG: hypothetical protein AABY32_05110 [Nanoarchaeota archaeon]
MAKIKKLTGKVSRYGPFSRTDGHKYNDSPSSELVIDGIVVKYEKSFRKIEKLIENMGKLSYKDFFSQFQTIKNELESYRIALK